MNERTSVDPFSDGPEDDLGRAAADVDDGDRALDRVAERLGRAEEREAALILVVEDLDVDRGDLLDLLDDLLAVVRLADRRGRHGLDRLGAELLGEPHLGGDDVGDLGDLLRGDLAFLDAALPIRV